MNHPHAGTQDEDDSAAFAVPSGQWAGHQWVGNQDAVRALAFIATPSSCHGACMTTCGCTYWQHDGNTGQCVLYRQPDGALSPVLTQASSPDTTAGIMFGALLFRSDILADEGPWGEVLAYCSS